MKRRELPTDSKSTVWRHGSPRSCVQPGLYAGTRGAVLLEYRLVHRLTGIPWLALLITQVTSQAPELSVERLLRSPPLSFPRQAAPSSLAEVQREDEEAWQFHRTRRVSGR